MSSDKIYEVAELFYSIQGEGARTGIPTHFIRFHGCNLACDFCDTKTEPLYRFTHAQLVAALTKWRSEVAPLCSQLVMTGGEPLLQVGEDLIADLKAEGFIIALETNGTIRPPFGPNWITVSPKAGITADALRANFPSGKAVDEVRIPIRAREGEPDWWPNCPITARHYFLSPVIERYDGPTRVNVGYALLLVKRNPRWRLGLQLHKLIGVK